jgi:hypothetical protein
MSFLTGLKKKAKHDKVNGFFNALNNQIILLILLTQRT